MLEPLLPHNRKAFDRLRRTQILGLIPVGVCTVVLILLLPRSSAEYVVLLFYAVIIRMLSRSTDRAWGRMRTSCEL